MKWYWPDEKKEIKRSRGYLDIKRSRGYLEIKRRKREIKRRKRDQEEIKNVNNS